MNEHLLPGEDRETFTTSKDMVENQTTCIIKQNIKGSL